MTLHAPVADPQYQQAAQRVVVLGAVRLVLAAAAAGELGWTWARRKVSSLMIGGWTMLLEQIHWSRRSTASWWCGRARRPDVDQHFVFALPVPDLPAGVAGVGEDGADGALGPGDAAAVRLRPGSCADGHGDAVTGQVLGDGVQAVPGEELGRRSAATTAAAGSSIARACSRLPSAALAGLGCGPASMSLYP